MGRGAAAAKKASACILEYVCARVHVLCDGLAQSFKCITMACSLISPSKAHTLLEVLPYSYNLMTHL